MQYSLIAEAVEGIVECIDEILKKEEKDDLDYGELLAYTESLKILKDAFTGYDLSKIGLDFDIDDKYLK